MLPQYIYTLIVVTLLSITMDTITLTGIGNGSGCTWDPCFSVTFGTCRAVSLDKVGSTY